MAESKKKIRWLSAWADARALIWAHRCRLLYGAIFHGNYSILLLMLEHGADPNLTADEPAESIYTEKPHALAKQCRFLMDWDKYDRIVRLLEQFGATDSDGSVDVVDLDDVKQRAREWQRPKPA